MRCAAALRNDRSMGEFNSTAAIAELSTQLGRAPNASELAAELQMEREDVVTMLLSGRRAAPRRPGNPVDDYLAMHRITDGEKLRPVLAALPDQQLAVMLLRFRDSLTHSQIAARTGLTKMQVSRLLATSLARVRENLR